MLEMYLMAFKSTRLSCHVYIRWIMG